MDIRNLSQSLDYLSSSGVMLSSEHRAALQTSLLLLLNRNKFSRVLFWGKISGVQDDYYIAQGFQEDLKKRKKTFYSKDCVRWGLLNEAGEGDREKARKLRGRFTGDPSFVAEYRLSKIKEGADGVVEYIDEMVSMKEEDRLAAVIAEIDDDVMIVPRGAYVRQTTGHVTENRHFEGLTPAEARRESNYQHFRRARHIHKMALLDRANFDPAIDFMDPIEDDIPKGSWSIQEQAGGVVVLRSLAWLGYSFYHQPGTRHYASAYFGTGEYNIDLPFMF